MESLMKPRRAFTLTIDVGGDTLADAIALVEHMIQQAERGSKSLVSGGCTSGGVMELKERPGFTNEQYQDELQSYLDARDAVEVA